MLAESADALMYDGVDIEVGRKIYHMLDQGFALLNQRKRADIIMAVFLADLLRNTGIGPNVDECAICGEKKISAISVRDGGFLCADCAGKQGMLLNSVTRLKQFRLICKADMDKYDIVESCVSDCREDVGLLLAILKEHGNIEIRSFGLYNRLFCH
ncbi:MAG: hypothetical protein EOM64_10470 [Erysipelotrichia bacterium]|nr:hypothetical protein [Erysipelotrichia bacterium]